MAVTYESVSLVSWAGISAGSNISFTTPTGLAVGDLIIVHIATNDEDTNGSLGSVGMASGFTLLGTLTNNDSNGGVAIVVGYKVATSDDISAPQFNFPNNSGQGIGMAGAMYRISGWGAVPTMASASNNATATPSFGNTITPPVADSLLLFLYTGTDSVGSSQSVSSYAIATDNPTWTERYDQYGNLFAAFGAGNGISPLMSGATASRTAITATGNSSCTITDSYNYNSGAIVCIQPPVNATVTPPVITITASIQDPTIGVAMSPSVISLSVSVPTPTVDVAVKIWTNQDKNSVSVTNQTKT